jgi:hypothetical protein
MSKHTRRNNKPKSQPKIAEEDLVPGDGRISIQINVVGADKIVMLFPRKITFLGMSANEAEKISHLLMDCVAKARSL